MLLVSALLICTPADFFAVSPPTIDLDKDTKEKKKKLRSTLALLWMVSIQFLTKGNMLSLLPVAQKSTFLQNVEIMAEKRDS